MPVLTPTEPALPALGTLADRGALAELLGRVPWLDGPDTAGVSVRLRWKPGTNLRAGLLVPTAGGVAALLVADFGTDTDKAGKLEVKLRAAGAPVLRDGALVVGPAAADPALRRWVPPGLVPLSYNPDRRFVGRAVGECDGGEVVKVHATAPAPAVRSLARRHSGTTWSRHRVGRTPWIPGRAPGPGDLDAVTDAVRELHRTAAPHGLPVLDAAAGLAASRRAASAVVRARPRLRDRLRRLVLALERSADRWPVTDAVLHGDLSRDQVLITSDGAAVLLDLDRATLGPAGWDGAVWAAAELADPGPQPVPAPVPAAPAVLRAAAFLQRAPEPFRRLRPDWPTRADALLAAAEQALQ